MKNKIYEAILIIGGILIACLLLFKGCYKVDVPVSVTEKFVQIKEVENTKKIDSLTVLLKASYKQTDNISKVKTVSQIKYIKIKEKVLIEVKTNSLDTITVKSLITTVDSLNTVNNYLIAEKDTLIELHEQKEYALNDQLMLKDFELSLKKDSLRNQSKEIKQLKQDVKVAKFMGWIKAVVIGSAGYGIGSFSR